jgi:hypothetical protein
MRSVIVAANMDMKATVNGSRSQTKVESHGFQW